MQLGVRLDVKFTGLKPVAAIFVPFYPERYPRLMAEFMADMKEIFGEDWGK